MVLRETTFEVGGALTIAMGILLGVGLLVSGAGFVLFDAWLAAGLAVGLGGFFLYVGYAEGADRSSRLDELEHGAARTPRLPPPGSVP